MASLLGAFNKLLLNFVEDLILTFPEESKFEVFKNALIALQKVNPRKVHTIFSSNLESFKEHILNKNEQFFLNNEYTEILNQSNDSVNINELIIKLKSYWRNNTLSDENKEKIWKYLNNLIKLSDMVASR